jgi:hypothetical protein
MAHLSLETQKNAKSASAHDRRRFSGEICFKGNPMTRQISVSIFILGLLCCLFKPAVQAQEKPVKLYVGVDVAKKNPKAKGAKPEDFISIAMLKEIDQSGFIDKLYKR